MSQHLAPLPALLRSHTWFRNCHFAPIAALYIHITWSIFEMKASHTSHPLCNSQHGDPTTFYRIRNEGTLKFEGRDVKDFCSVTNLVMHDKQSDSFRNQGGLDRGFLWRSTMKLLPHNSKGKNKKISHLSTSSSNLRRRHTRARGKSTIPSNMALCY